MTSTVLGQSDAADQVQKRSAEIQGYLHESNYLGQQPTIRGELIEVWNECRYPDWDGYGALPVEWESVANTKRFLELLPFRLPVASIGAEPDGCVTLEWYASPRRTLSVSIGPSEQLHYAALLGSGEVCGGERFVDHVPSMILGLINRVYS